MKFRILGSASGMPTINKHHSSIWINFSDKNILLDCGEGTAKQMLKFGLDKDFLDAIVISHYHPDHVSGLFMVIQMLYLQKRKQDLSIYLPEHIEKFKDILNLFYTFLSKIPFNIYFSLVPSLTDDFPEIDIIKSDHLLDYESIVKSNGFINEFNSYSFGINVNNKKLLYTSDCTTLKPYKSMLASTDVLIVDAMHPDSDEILELPKLSSGKIILSHGLSSKLEESLNLNKNDRFEIADEEKEYIL